MHIGLIIDPYEEKTPSGLGHGLFAQAKALVEEGQQNTYTLYLKKFKELPAIGGTHWHAEALGGTSLFFNSARAMDRSLDMYVFLTPIIPLLFFPKKSVVVVHDYAYLELPQRSLAQRCMSLLLYAAHQVSLWKATKIIAVSQATKESTIKHFHIAPEKIQVIYNGFAPHLGTLEKVEVPELFFLFAGVLKERKNVAGIIKAFALFAKQDTSHRLLIAGKQSGPYAESLLRLTHELGVEKRVRFLGYVRDGELAYLYSRAEALIFPSFIEGFGIPVLEAMHAGLPVITSSTGALAEVAADAALLVDPSRPEDIAAAMRHIATDASLRHALIEKGRARATQFSWQKTAREMLRLCADT